uniref:Ig-like domain-containing protein n=1 Tax=Periophthalmus magnuspinnatus TaxID=409849 RepID=A0A3B4A252_9GOBI
MSALPTDHSDSSPSEDSMGHTDQHFPDLSAFLSQEELDKSVNLARQAIGHEPRDERAEVKGHSEICSAPVTYPPTSSDSFTNSPSINVPFNPTQTNAITQPASEFRETPHTTYAPDRKTHKPSSRQDNVRNSRDSGDAYNDFNRSSRSVPYGLETQSKKEFLNKAADFIEELSSLFKANSSKRVRPRSCKTHRGRSQNKSQADGMVLPIACDNRERSVLAPDIDKDRPGPVDDQEPEVQADSRTEEFQECVSEEQQFATVTSEGTEAVSTALTESSFPVDTVCEPPKFIQKLKSREVSEGSKVQLDCIVQGQPVPEVRWFCEGKELENCPDIQIITNGEHHSLIIAEAFEEDTGRYSCFASNFYGTDSTSAEIYVEEPLSSAPEPLSSAPVPLSSAPVLLSSAPVPLSSPPEEINVSPITLPTIAPVQQLFKPVEAERQEVLAPVQLQDLDASEGQLVVLECRVKGTPSPRVEWYQDSKLIQDSPEFRILQKSKQSDICTLVIAEVFPEDSGTFKCTASNNYGSVSSTAELKIKATSSPTIPPFSPPPRIFPTRVLQSPTSPPSLVSSPTLGSMLLNTVFGLRAQSPPQAASPTSSSSTPSPIQNPVAFLSSVLPSLSPLKATNEMGLPKRTAKARVPSLEEIRESKECLLIDIEKKLRLKDDTPQYQHQQMATLCMNSLHEITVTVNALFIVKVLIHCYIIFQEYKISNFEQRLMSEIEFRLERTPVEESDDEVQHEDVPTGKCIAPIFDKKLKNFRAMEGVPVTFSCKLVGVPVPKVYWFKDGKQILRKNTHYRKIREGDGTCALHIESVTSDDDGNYTVMAANPQGRISCSGHLIVQTGSARNRQTPISAQRTDNVSLCRVRSRIQEVETEQTQERFFRPHFLQAPGDMMAHEGKLCRLDCKVSGLPNPELMWLVNGRPIYPDLYHKMLVRENGVHSLVIDPLTQKDAGTYTCIASNKAGQSSFNLELSVVEKEMKHPPQFVEKLQNMGIPEGTPVRLECRVVGMPSPVIFWKKDNETIPRTRDRISMHQDVTGYVCLLIQPTTKEDAGWYTVSAKNEAGIVSCTCRLDIYGIGSQIPFYQM